MSTQVASEQTASGRTFHGPLRKIVVIIFPIAIVLELIAFVLILLSFQEQQAKYQDCLAQIAAYAQRGTTLSCDNLGPNAKLWSNVFAVGAPIVMTLLAVFQLMMTWRQSLCISAEGIECTYDLYSYRTTWDNVERLAHGPFGLIRITYDQLILREPATDTGRRLTLHVPKNLRCVIPIGLYSLVWRLIPIGYYPSPGRAEAIRQEIGKYAPRLLVDGVQDNLPAVRSLTNG